VRSLQDESAIKEASELSGCGVEHVCRLARQGEIRTAKKGGDWWIDVEMFTAHLNTVLEGEDGRAGPKTGQAGNILILADL
jgi:hypothetical protein